MFAAHTALCNLHAIVTPSLVAMTERCHSLRRDRSNTAHDFRHLNKRLRLETYILKRVILSTERHSIRCCDDKGRLLSNNPDVHCFPITIPEDDPVFSKFNRECMNFVRSTTDQETGCNPGNKPAEQVI